MKKKNPSELNFRINIYKDERFSKKGIKDQEYQKNEKAIID